MVDEPIHDDSSYYEISITAGQAFLAVVLLIGSLAAAFAFGIVVGEARGKTTLTQKVRPPVILEESGSDRGRIVELGVDDEAFESSTTRETVETVPPIDTPELIEDPTPGEGPGTPSLSVPGPTPPVEPAEAVPHVAQILSTTEKDPAEKLAARLIDAGFSNSYVERVPSEAGMLYRVRVRFASESEARGAVDRLKPYAPGEIWISRAEP